MAKNPLTKLMVVDDDSDNLLVVKYSLEDIPNVTIEYAASGEEALQILQRFIPDLILLDVMMPKMDGFETFKAIRKLPFLENTPIVFFTAKVQKKDIESQLKFGAIDVIIKPFDSLADQILAIWENYQRQLV